MNRAYLAHLFADNQIVELRHQVGHKWVTGWFNDATALIRAASKLAGRGNLFTSLQVPRFHGAPNRMTGEPLVNDEVERYSRLFFDFDPERPTDTAATRNELRHAYAVRQRVLQMLNALQWPRPLMAFSGNGFHAQYRVALPNDSAAGEMLRVTYDGLAAEFSNELATFDRSVKNAGRICTLYGSVKRKGRPTAERPHRISRVKIPIPWRQVTQRQVEAVANFYAKQQRTAEVYRLKPRVNVAGKGDYRTLDVVAWFAAHGLYLRPSSYAGKHYAKCPWALEHSTIQHDRDTSTVIWEADGGWPSFHCSHAHCVGRTLRHVMELFGDADNYCQAEWRRETT